MAKIIVRGANMERGKEYMFLVIIEKAERNFSAYSPDLPGCVATGKTLEEVKGNMQAAIEMHVRGMIEDGLPIPEPRRREEFAGIEFMAVAV